MIAGLIALFALGQLVKAFRTDERRSYEITPSVVVTVAIAAGLVVGYVVLMPYLGFVIATILFLVVSMHFSGVEKARKSILVSLGITLLLHYVFVQFLRIPLPENPIVPIGRLLPSIPLLVEVGLA
jgi:hypothetical protein